MKTNSKLSCCRVALGLLLSVTWALVGQPAQAQFIQHRSVQPTPEEREALRNSYLEARTASAFLHAGHYAQAEAEARQSLFLRSNCGLGDEVLAAALDAQGKEQEALKAYQTVVEHHDRNPRNVLPYALLLLKSGGHACEQSLLARLAGADGSGSSHPYRPRSGIWSGGRLGG